jgi:hypothetical protein
MKSILAGLGIPAHGTVGSCLLLDLGSQTRARSFVAALRADGIYVKGPWAAPWDRYITISLGPLDVMTRFIDAARAFYATARVA